MRDKALSSFVAVGNGVVGFDAEAFRAIVRVAAVDGRPAARDPEQTASRPRRAGVPGSRANVGRLLAPDHLEPCPRILARTAGVLLVTDDNLAGEAAAPWYAYYSAPPPE